MADVRFGRLAVLALAFVATTGMTSATTQQPAAPAPTVGVVVPAGARSVDVTILRGPVDVYGTVDGDVMTLSGDIVVHPGARVTGDVSSAFGSVRVLAGGTVLGAARSLSNVSGVSGPQSVAAVAPSRPDTWHAVKLVLGWVTILVVIGLGILVTASPYLDGVAEAFEGNFTRALGVGIVGQMLALPALLVLVVALTLTLIGVLAVPLAVVAFVIAVAGLVTLGFLAVAFVTGRSLLGGARSPARHRASSARGEALVALTLGVAVYLALWLASAALTSLPIVAVVLRTIALATTWVAATAGFGATLLSRAGTRSAAVREVAPQGTERPAYQSPVSGWQTPTPVHGVVAARRPVATASQE